MEEIFPVSAGIMLGLVAHLLGSVRLKAALIGSFGIAIGALASWVSGELAISWVYLLVDTAQVVAAGAMTAVLVRAWSRRHTRKVAQLRGRTRLGLARPYRATSNGAVLG